MKIYFASGNTHKREELSRILANHEIILPLDEGISFNPEETESTFLGNALIKAKALYTLTGKPVIADDSGLCVDALGGAPGVLSARYGSVPGHILSTDEKNKLVLFQMKGVMDRKCRFVCAMVFYFSPDRFYSVQETLEGSIVIEGRGSAGFGYDPIVFLPEYGKTVAELEPEKKDRCSHRGKAGRHLATLLNAF